VKLAGGVRRSFQRSRRSFVFIDTIYRTFRGALEVKLKERSELLPVSSAYAHLFRDSARR
jgi:hypothetical protein